MERPAYKIGDCVEMKKKHPCGSFHWKIIRVGTDIKLKCQGCAHIIMIPRMKFSKSFKKILTQDESENLS